jgi:Rrf2 family protein
VRDIAAKIDGWEPRARVQAPREHPPQPCSWPVPRVHAVGKTGAVRISLRVDYAVRAMAQLAADVTGQPVKAASIAGAQNIPSKFLGGILNDLKRAHLVRSQRGAEGGYTLSRPPSEISLADVIRAVDGPLANVHDTSLAQLRYSGPAEPLPEVWMAVRASLRSVLEAVTLADLVAGTLPEHVQALAAQYRADVRR